MQLSSDGHPTARPHRPEDEKSRQQKINGKHVVASPSPPGEQANKEESNIRRVHACLVLSRLDLLAIARNKKSCCFFEFNVPGQRRIFPPLTSPSEKKGREGSSASSLFFFTQHAVLRRTYDHQHSATSGFHTKLLTTKRIRSTT